jgi:hypothetical protein
MIIDINNKKGAVNTYALLPLIHDGELEWGAEPYKIPLVIEKEEELEVAVEQREGEGNRELRRTSFVSESASRNVGTDLEAKCPNE